MEALGGRESLLRATKVSQTPPPSSRKGETKVARGLLELVGEDHGGKVNGSPGWRAGWGQ